MMTMRTFYLMGLILLAGCNQVAKPANSDGPLIIPPALEKPGPVATAPTKTPQKDLELLIIPSAKSFQTWNKGSVSVKVKNATDTPVFLESVTITTDKSHPIAREECTVSMTGRFKGEGFEIRGTYLTEYIGAEARLPSPPYWDWEGDRLITTGMILLPSTATVWSGQFRAELGMGSRFVVRVRYAPITKETPLLQQTRFTVKPVEEKTESWDSRRGWLATVRTALDYEKSMIPISNGLSKTTSKKYAGPSGTLQNQFAHPPLLPYRYGIEESNYNKMVWKTVNEEMPFVVERHAFGIDKARKRCNIPKGAYARLVKEGAWAIAGDGVTFLVSQKETVRVAGDALPFIKAMNNRRSMNVRIFAWDEDSDPEDHLIYFEDRAFESWSRKEKDGSWSGYVRVPASRVTSFLGHLTTLGFQMNGTRSATRGS